MITAKEAAERAIKAQPSRVTPKFLEELQKLIEKVADEGKFSVEFNYSPLSFDNNETKWIEMYCFDNNETKWIEMYLRNLGYYVERRTRNVEHGCGYATEYYFNISW